jgi:V-type H+-transporting ATPase proteolipid subunit
MLLMFRIGVGAAYGTAKSGIGIAGVGTFRPDLIMKVKIEWP